MNGRTLHDIIRAQGAMPPRRAAEVVTDVCGVLNFAHRRGITHGAISAENVLLTRTGMTKVLNFGAGFPSHYHGDLAEMIWQDVSAAGCLLYELIMGEPQRFERIPEPPETAFAELVFRDSAVLTREAGYVSSTPYSK